MLMMRLQRVGRKNDPAYRVVVVDKRTGPKSNKNIDLIGNYYPKTGEINLNAEKVAKWLAHGVQPSDTVYNMLVTHKLIEGKKRNALPKKSPIVDEEKLKAEAEAKAAAEASEAESENTDEAAAEEPVAETETPDDGPAEEGTEEEKVAA